MMAEKGSSNLVLAFVAVLLLGSVAFVGTSSINYIKEVFLTSDPDSSWVTVSYSPDILNYAVAVTGANGDIYIANSTSSGNPNYTSYLWRYNTSDNTWDSLSLSLPNQFWWKPGKPSSGRGAFKNGTCMVWDNGDYTYTLFGASYADGSDGYYRHYFARYSISGDNWEQLENTPNPKGQGPGDAITWVPGSVLGTETDWIYAVVGSKTSKHGTTFCRYNINDDIWEILPYNPSWSGGADDGSSLVWAGGDYLYALQGEWHESHGYEDRAFARFDLTDNTWDDLPDIPEEGGVGDGGSLVWVGGSYSDNIYALGGGAAYPEVPGENFYCYSISGNSWMQLQDLLYGITDQNGPRLGYANENIYCWRGYNGASEGPKDVLWAYAVPEVGPERGVSISISPSYQGGLPGDILEFTVKVRNTGDVLDNYLLENSDNQGWILELDNDTLTIPPGENRATTLSVTIPDNAVGYAMDNITVTATSRADNAVSDGDSCIAHVTLWAGTATFKLEDLYKVSLEKDLQLLAGSKLVVKFYTYDDAYENENVIENFSPPWHVEENESARHPENIGVKKARLDLTHDNTENVIATIASFTVRKVDLETRFMEIPFYWSQADDAGKVELETEFMAIPFYWSQAPS